VHPSLYEKKLNQFRGAFIIKPKPGIKKWMLVLDFTSLYNRIMQLGLSKETIMMFKKTNPLEVKLTEDLPYWFKDYQNFLARNNLNPILSHILKKMEALRNFYKAERQRHKKHSDEWEKYNRMQESVKSILLSFYGCIGSEHSRYYDVDMAEAVTGIGRYLIKKTIEKVTSLGYEIAYGDTDSCFVLSNIIETGNDETDIKQAIEIGNKIMNELNIMYDKIFEEQNVPKQNRKIEIKFEKIFKKIVFMGDEDTAKKKRYCCLQVYEEGIILPKPSLEITGLEAIRDDWSNLAKELQLKIINMIMEEKTIPEMVEAVNQYRTKVINKKLSIDDLTIRQRLSKPIEEYEGEIMDSKTGVAKLYSDGKTRNKTPSPHIRMAKQMRDNGEEIVVGMQIEYTINAKGHFIPISQYTDGDYSISIFWNDKLYAPTERVLESAYPRYDWSQYRIDERKEKILRENKTLTSFA
jgi:DNA polymerase elongation subunit (family B)